MLLIDAIIHHFIKASLNTLCNRNLSFSVGELCEKAKVLLAKAKDQFSSLVGKIPLNQYYRFNDHWRFVMQRYTFLVTLVYFLEAEKLALHSDVAQLLGGNS